MARSGRCNGSMPLKALRKRSLWILLAVTLLSLLIFCLWYDRQIRQQRLDRALIAAIKHNRIPTAIALLDAGADANTVDKPRKPITWNSLLADFGSRFHGYVPPKETEYYPPALLLPY